MGSHPGGIRSGGTRRDKQSPVLFSGFNGEYSEKLI